MKPGTIIVSQVLRGKIFLLLNGWETVIPDSGAINSIKQTLKAPVTYSPRSTQWPPVNARFDLDAFGWSIKRISIKVKKKYMKKRRWPSRKMKTWHMNNTNMMFVFAKKFPIMIYVADMAILMSNFWQFWQWPNILKTCSLSFFFYCKNIFILGSLDIAKNTK